MNRKHAEHILDAYVRMRMCESDTDASNALREVILDAMTGYRVHTTYPTITLPSVGYPSTSPYKPIVTCGVGE